MRYAPNKIFMLEDGQYIEISYEYYQRLVEENSMRRFWLFGGMLMELPEEDYVQMNREKSRMQYHWEKAKQVGLFSFDSLGADDFNGQMILGDYGPDVGEEVEQRIMSEKLHEAIKELSDEDAELVQALFFEGVTERTYAEKLNISQVAVHKRKKKVLEKLRKILG